MCLEQPLYLIHSSGFNLTFRRTSLSSRAMRHISSFLESSSLSLQHPTRMPFDSDGSVWDITNEVIWITTLEASSIIFLLFVFLWLSKSCLLSSWGSMNKTFSSSKVFLNSLTPWHNLHHCYRRGSPSPFQVSHWDFRLPICRLEVEVIDAAESVRDAIGFEYCLASSCGWTKSPVLWAEFGESSLTGLKLVQETIDKVVLIKEKLKAAKDRQKSYADKRRKPLEFEVGDQVLLRVSPRKGVMHFEKKGKLAPRYVGPFEILERIGLVAYMLRLPEELSSVHDTFHVSNLKKCLADANLHVSLDEIKVDKILRFVEEPVEVMDREIKKLKRRKIALVKVRWNLKCGPEFTWENKDQIRIKYPQLFVDRVFEPAS
ncbi:hypothetical protein Tco_0830953 [Tanacetum coccineum]